MIFIENRRRSEKKLSEKYPNALILDITSKGVDQWVKLSPFYPHGNIPIPFSDGLTAQSVEGIWQGLKVFEMSDIDYTTFSNDKMKNIKRTVRKFGKPIGHRKGVKGAELLNYFEARFQIYLPSYLWVLQNKLEPVIQKLRVISKEKDLVLLDYETNCDILNLKKPVSHAYLVKCYIEGHYPTLENIDSYKISDTTKMESITKLNPSKLKKRVGNPTTKKKNAALPDSSQTALDI